MSRKAPDRSGEELRLELEALNQVLQYRCHTRCKSYRVASPRHPSPKHPLHPKPSFKVPFRSTSVISSCAHFPAAQASPSCNKPPYQPKKEKQPGPPQFPSQYPEKKITRRDRNGHDHQHQEPERQIGFWRSWPRSLRAISHLITSSRRRRLHVLFSLHIHRIEGLPLPMNGLRLAVRWTCQDHGLQTMPSRIFHGTADFEETLVHRCTMYGTHSSNDINRYDEKPSTVSIVALDVDELELAKHHMDMASLLQNYDINLHPQQQITSYELSGMAKGSTLIASFRHELTDGKTVRGKDANLVRINQQLNKTPGVSTKSLVFFKQACPALVDESALGSSPPPSKPGADSVLHHPGAQKFLDESPIELQAASSADNAALEGSTVSEYGSGKSFEFQSNSLDFSAEVEHQEQFSFPQAEEARLASIKTFHSPLYEGEGLLQVDFPFNQTMQECQSSSLREDEEGKLDTQMQSEQGTALCGESQQEGAAIGEWAQEESKFIKVLQADSDDEADLIAEEFFNLLGIT